MVLELWQVALLLLVGTVGGFLNVMAGGGSLLTVPVLVFLGLPGPVANGTNRIAILVQNITAITTFFRHGHADFRRSLGLALCAIPGAILGALFGTELEGPWFNRTLAIIMIAVMYGHLFAILAGPSSRDARLLDVIRAPTTITSSTT